MPKAFPGARAGVFPHMKITPRYLHLILSSLGVAMVLSAATPRLHAQEPAFLNKISEFDYGKDQKVPFEIAAYIRDNKGDAAKLRAFAEAMKGKASAAKTDDPLALACTTLASLGSDEDVKFLAEQLPKKGVYAAARNALQQVGSPVAAKALQDFAAGAPADQAAPVLLCLGRMKAGAAVPFLAQKAGDKDKLVSRAAFAALADIATPEALAAINKFEPKADDGSAVSMISLAETLAVKGDKTQAAALIDKVIAASALPEDTRIAAMRLVLLKDLPSGAELLNKLATNPQPATQPLVLANFARLSADQQKAIVADIVRTQDSKEAVLKLIITGQSFPVASLLDLIYSKNALMQRTAMSLLARGATKAEFDKLLADYLALPAGDPKQEATRNALIAMPAVANTWLAESLKQATQPNQQIALIGLAKERLARTVDESILNLIGSNDPEVKKAALEALAALGAPTQAGHLLDLLLASKSPVERRDLSKALAISLRQSKDKSAVIAKATNQLATVQDPAIKDVIIDLMGKSNEPECLPVLFAEFQKSDKARRTVILRAISNWQDDAPLDQLAIIAASDPDSASRIFSLRAFLDILNRSQELTPEAKLQRLWQAYLLAQRPEEHKMIVSQAATVALPATRMLLGSYRFDPDVKAELSAATKAHDALIAAPAKKEAVDAEEGLQKEEDPAETDKPKAVAKKDKYPENPFDNAGQFEKWEDPLGLAGRWTGGDVQLDMVQYPNQTFQALLTVGGAAPKKVIGLIDQNSVLHLYGQGVTGTLSRNGGELTVDGKKAELKRTVVGKVDAVPRPAKAKVIFDGKSLEAFRATKNQILPDGAVEMKAKIGSLVTKENFGDARVYLEFRMPYNPESLGPRRGNSGVYLMNTYEVQLQDGFGTELSSVGAEPADRFCGSIYGIAAPKLNACAPPLEWQSMVVEFRAPKFGADGKKTQNAKMSVWQNGILIQDSVDVPRPTGGDADAVEKLKPEPKEPAFLLLQNHGNSLQFRNIWVEPLS